MIIEKLSSGSCLGVQLLPRPDALGLAVPPSAEMYSTRDCRTSWPIHGVPDARHSAQSRARKLLPVANDPASMVTVP